MAGDDLLTFDANGASGPAVLQGNEGNDTLRSADVDFGLDATLDGGAGDDLLQSNVFVRGDAEEVYITGEGADVIEVSAYDTGTNDNLAIGLFGRVTDFDPAQDMLLVDPSWLVRDLDTGFDQGFVQTLSLSEDTAGDFTDVTMRVIANANGNAFEGTLRLEGLTGLSESDISLGLSAEGGEEFGFLAGGNGFTNQSS